MRIESTNDLMRACVSTMLTCAEAPAIQEGLLAVYAIATKLEQEHEISPSVEDLRQGVMENFDAKLEEFPIPPPEDFNLEELTKCFGAWLWCLRMVELVTETGDRLTAMAVTHDLLSRMQDNTFREENA
tara:strand:+ start:1390 stop:1776 length:387 start_codon:yes stop_codon:yes gene_type:complete